MTSTVFEHLRADIMEGVLAPAERLLIKSLCKRYSVGASPLREALNRLTSLGLVEQIDQRGFRVAPINEARLQELAVTRCWVNEIVIREAIAAGDQAWEEQIVLAFHRLWRCPLNFTNQPDRQWDLHHRRFHSALIAACPSHFMRDFYEALSDYADRHRNLAARSGFARRRNPVAEHREIMEAVIQRDTERALRLLNEHFMMTTRLAVNSASVLDKNNTSAAQS